MKAEIEITETGERVELIITPENDLEAIALGMWVQMDKNGSSHSAIRFTGLPVGDIYRDCAPAE